MSCDSQPSKVKDEALEYRMESTCSLRSVYLTGVYYSGLIIHDISTPKTTNLDLQKLELDYDNVMVKFNNSSICRLLNQLQRT